MVLLPVVLGLVDFYHHKSNTSEVCTKGLDVPMSTWVTLTSRWRRLQDILGSAHPPNHSSMLVGFMRCSGVEYGCYKLCDADPLSAGPRFQGGCSHGVKTVRVDSLVVSLPRSALLVGFGSKHTDYGRDGACDYRQDKRNAKRSAEEIVVCYQEAPYRQQHHASRDGDEYQGGSQQ